MPLADFVKTRERIEFPGGEFFVRAVDLSDVAAIIHSHRDAVDNIASAARARKDQLFTDPEIAVEAIVEAIQESPALVAHLIARCSDEPGEGLIAIAAGLPVPVQIEAIKAIGHLTFADDIAIKNFATSVMNLVRAILPAPTAALENEGRVGQSASIEGSVETPAS